MQSKTILRKKFRSKREGFTNRMSSAERQLTFSTVPSPLKSIFEKASVIGAYSPIGNEANPLKLLKIADEMGKTTCLPHIQSKISPMQFIQWKLEDPLIEGPMGLQQPPIKNEICTPDVIIIPLLAFDRSMNRLGQGAGHYDRALSIIDNSINIGLAWSVQEEEELPADSWDQPMDAVLTEREWII